MGKNHRVPEPEKSAFESAKAEFERAGEEDLPVSKTVELTKTVPEGATDAPAVPETPVSETDSPAASETDLPATDETDETPVSEPEMSEETDSPASDETDVSETSDETDSPAAPETPASETDAPAAPEASEETDSPAASEMPDEADAETVETPVPEADPETPPSESDDDSETDDAEDDFPDSPDYPESEVTEMEKSAMETKEITLGYHRSPPETDTKPFATQADKDPKAHEKKPRFKAFDQLKDAFRSREATDDNETSGSSRDAALRKRVMQIEDEETRNYLLDRVLPQMTWYSKKVAQYRTMYYRLMATTILLGGLIPVFSVGANSTAVKVIIAFLGASVTAINAYIGLHNYRDLWLTYQTARENLIHTLYCYFNNAGVFAHGTSLEDLNVLLVDVCEDTLSKEHGGWTTILQKG